MNPAQPLFKTFAVGRSAHRSFNLNILPPTLNSKQLPVGTSEITYGNGNLSHIGVRTDAKQLLMQFFVYLVIATET